MARYRPTHETTVQPSGSNNSNSTGFDENNIQEFQSTGGGTYGEGTAFQGVEYLKRLRGLLDQGKINVSTFLQYGQAAAQQTYQSIAGVAGQGSKAANIVTPFLQQIKDLGFSNGANGITPNLPTKYQTALREELAGSILPGDASQEERQALLGQIPNNIDINSDRGRIELEALRQKYQLKSQLGSLNNLLTKESDRQFDLSRPGLYEDLNARGLLDSSALGESLAREKGNLESQRQFALGQAEIGGLDAIRQMQTGGLQRQFSLQDFDSQSALAREIAAMQSQGQSQGGNGLAGAFSGALGGAAIGATTTKSPYGAIGGAVLGGAGGYAANKPGGTYICTAMKDAGILSELEVQEIHDHLYPIFHKNIHAILTYTVFGPELVFRAISKRIDWKKWKEIFFHEVMSHENPQDSFEAYKNAFLSLWKEVS